MYVQVYGRDFTHYAMDHFERAVMATEKTHWCAEICWIYSNV
jgi:hypothetical protein